MNVAVDYAIDIPVYARDGEPRTCISFSHVYLWWREHQLTDIQLQSIFYARELRPPSTLKHCRSSHEFSVRMMTS